MSRIISHVCKVFLPTNGGVQRVVDEICQTTFDTHVSEVISTARDKNTSTYSYAYAPLKLARSYFDLLSTPVAPNVIRLIYRAIRRNDVCAIHYPYPIADIAVSFFSLFKKTTVVVHWHSNIYSQKKTERLIRPFTHIMLSKATKIVVSSPEMINNSKLLTSFRSKCVVIPYGTKKLPAPVKVDSIDADAYFISIGRHVEYKGFKYLIEAMRLNSHKLIMLGDGPLYDTHRALIDEYGLADRVTLVREVSDSEKQEYLAKALVLILPSIYPSEAFAIVQIEAMMLGKPVINTQLASGVPWVARDGLEAITVNPSDSTALNVAMDKIISDARLREELAKNAYRRACDLFSKPVFQKNIDSLYRPLMQ